MDELLTDTHEEEEHPDNAEQVKCVCSIHEVGGEWTREGTLGVVWVCGGNHFRLAKYVLLVLGLWDRKGVIARLCLSTMTLTLSFSGTQRVSLGKRYWGCEPEAMITTAPSHKSNTAILRMYGTIGKNSVDFMQLTALYENN